MSLDHILLGLLRGPACGYDLKQEFSQGVRHFWSAELSQIYPALNRLEAKKYLRSSRQRSALGPERRVYRRTASGRKELLRWLRSGPKMGAQRFAYLAQLAFMHELENLEATLDFMRQLKRELGEFLSFLEDTEQELLRLEKAGTSLSDVHFHDLLCVRMGVTSIRARIGWCDECIARIRNRLKKPGKGKAEASE